MDEEKQKQIQAVIKSEKSRGSRKPLDFLSMMQQLELRADIRELLRPETTEGDFLDFMRALAVPEERFDEALKIWRALRRSA
jgi:hypothetical protein